MPRLCERLRVERLFEVNKPYIFYTIARRLLYYIIIFPRRFSQRKRHSVSPCGIERNLPQDTFILAALSLYYWEQDPVFKEKLKKIAFEKLPYYLDKFEEQVKKNGGYFVNAKVISFNCTPRCLVNCLVNFCLVRRMKRIFFCRFQLSWADFLWAAYCDYLGFVLGGDPNKDHPELKKLVEKVRSLPNVKAYIEKRPKTQL